MGIRDAMPRPEERLVRRDWRPVEREMEKRI
jgi:hypothetical protein